jgi:hypothetical protein
MKKICTGCGEERDAESGFNWKYKNRGVRHSRCKVCQSQISKRHYQRNKQSYIARSHARNEMTIVENRRKLASYLLCHPCVDCGYADICVLEFDHTNGTKRGNIARMLRNCYSWSSIEAEMAKCEVRCANCHRTKTGATNDKRASWRHSFETLDERIIPGAGRSIGAIRKAQTVVENQRRLYAYLSEHPCVDCGNSDIRILEFDHVRGRKRDDVAELLTNGATWTTILTEIAKCEVRCVNCHRIKTSERGDWWRFTRIE